MDAHAPNPRPSTTLAWLELEYEANSTNDARYVTASVVDPEADVAALGAWLGLDLGTPAFLSAKVVDDRLYVLTARKPRPPTAGGGCCADTLRAYARDGGAVVDHDLDAILGGVFPKGVAFHHATHQFDVYTTKKGNVEALFVIQWTDKTLGGARVNGLVKVDLGHDSVIPTADGDLYYAYESKLGTTSTAYADSIYKLPYIQNASKFEGEEWHGNGVHRFEALSGDVLLAISHRFLQEAVVVRDPWRYNATSGGDAILQRFGTPPYEGPADGAPAYHTFGLGAKAGPGLSPWAGGVHNVWYTKASATTGALKGKETITLFINSIAGQKTSAIVEFELKLAPRTSAAPTDAVFDVPFNLRPTAFLADAMGGGRVIADGLYLVAGGIGDGVFELVDSRGAKDSARDLVYPGPSGRANTSLYDTFCRVLVEA